MPPTWDCGSFLDYLLWCNAAFPRAAAWPGSAHLNLKGEVMNYRNLVLMMGVVLFGYSTISFLYLSTASSKPSPVPNKVVDDQVQQYNWAVKAGSQTDRCVQAGFVASAYIQAKDEPNYQAWSGIRNNECKAAGLAQ